MTYTLFIGDRSFSSWSMRGWLMLECFDLPFETVDVGLYAGTLAQDLQSVAPARTVPALRTAEGHVLSDTLAIAETLAERHPGIGLWPGDAGQRALARSMVAEMHSGFDALRGDCPMQLHHQWVGFQPSDGVRADLDRITFLWSLALGRSGGPWLFGDYSIADAFFAPVAMRIAGYGLDLPQFALDYVSRHLGDPAVRRWRARGLCDQYDVFPYPQPLQKTDWPGPVPEKARKVDGPAVNTQCPYSGKAVREYLEFRGNVYGFCNALCRDKTLHDPTAFPAFMAILQDE